MIRSSARCKGGAPHLPDLKFEIVHLFTLLQVRFTQQANFCSFLFPSTQNKEYSLTHLIHKSHHLKFQAFVWLFTSSRPDQLSFPIHLCYCRCWTRSDFCRAGEITVVPSNLLVLMNCRYCGKEGEGRVEIHESEWIVSLERRTTRLRGS